MGKNYDFEYIIIGSGPAGRTAALNLANAKKSVAIVEEGDFGGAEFNTRDLPYKIALDFAYTYHNVMSSPAISGGSRHFNLPTLTSEINSTAKKAAKTAKEELEKAGAKILNGFAHFIDSNTLAVEDRQYTAENFIIATGADLKASEIAGLDSINYITPDTFLDIRRLPKYVFIIGGGPTGVSIAEFFANLGIGVIIMERGAHLLPREDEDVAELVTKHFTSNLGVSVIPNAKVLQVTEDNMSKIVVFMSEGSEKMVRVDSIVVATGSEPYLDCSLENAGVDYKRSGIIVDKYFNTTARNIFAIGDCIGGSDSSTERAIREANTLTENILHRGKTAINYSGIIRIIPTHPEIAVVGLNERDATARDLNYKKEIVKLQDGFIKTITDRSGRFLGATVVSPNAGLAFKLHKLLQK